MGEARRAKALHLPTVDSMAAHACPCQRKHEPDKKPFPASFEPSASPLPASAKIRTRRWKACYWSGCRGGPASEGNKTSCFLQGTNQAKAKVIQASGSPRKCCLPLGPCDRK